MCHRLVLGAVGMRRRKEGSRAGLRISLLVCAVNRPRSAWPENHIYESSTTQPSDYAKAESAAGTPAGYLPETNSLPHVVQTAF
jgi:hypothetical protein